MLNPLGGLAMVHTGVDAMPIIEALAPLAESPYETGSKPGGLHQYLATINRRPAVTYTSTPAAELPNELRGRMRELTTAMRGTMDPVYEAMGVPSGYQRLMVHNRLRASQIEHVDTDTTITYWLGATLPGLQMFHKDQWQTIDSAPEGHMLVWRGVSSYSGDRPGQLHRVHYRSTGVRRGILLAYDLGSCDFI
ncbi:MAG: hypothetical protein JWO41_661 [Candidatus Saccharibacteria bacterium]|nr:hypothetical protein [Candidatus Saccharibacteria bacterium]